MNKLWLGLDLQAAIAAPILHVDSKGRVEYEPNFSQVRPWAKRPLDRRLGACLQSPRWGLSF